MSILKTSAVRLVKPVVSEERWQRWRAAASALTVTDPAEPALTARQERRRRFRSMSLTEHALAYGTDKAGSHHYTQHYERHLQHLRDEKFTLLEIGIGGYSKKQKGGNSLRMWRAFFLDAQIIGLDIEDKSFVDGHRIKSYQGSQVDEGALERIFEENGPIEVIIDDGSHRPEHVRETFRILFPKLEPNGVYVIEDTQTSHWPQWGGSSDLQARDTTMALVKDLIDGLNFEEYTEPGYEPTYSERHVVAVHAYHNLVFIQKGVNNEGTNLPLHRR